MFWQKPAARPARASQHPTMVSAATALASAGRSNERRKALAINRARLAALMKRFPGHSRVALRQLERYGWIYAAAEQRRARAARRLS